MPLTLYYWNSKGFAEPTRLLLHYLKVNYDEFTWVDNAGWAAKRDEIFVDPIDSPFPAFPILIDGEFILSGDEAIHYYVCKKFGGVLLYGKTLQDQVRVRQINTLLGKMHKLTIFSGIASKDYEKNFTKFLKEDGEIAQSIKSLAGFLADKDFLLGYLTVSDIRTTYELRYVRNAALSIGLDDPVVGKHDNLVALIKRVAALPELQGFAGGPRDYKFTPEGLSPWYNEYPLE